MIRPVSCTVERVPTAASVLVSSCLTAVVLLAKTPVLLSQSDGMLGGNLLVHHCSFLLPCKVQSVCVCVCINMRFGLNQGRKLVHFCSPGWMWPLTTVLLLQLREGKSCRKSEFEYQHFPMKMNKTAVEDELSFCSTGSVLWAVCGSKGGGDRLILDILTVAMVKGSRKS